MKESLLLLLFALFALALDYTFIAYLFFLAFALFVVAYFLQKFFSFGKNIAQKSTSSLKKEYEAFASAEPSVPQGTMSTTIKEAGRIVGEDTFKQGQYWTMPQGEVPLKERLSKVFIDLWNKIFGHFK